MFKYLKRKLGIDDLQSEISELKKSIPALDARNRAVLTAVETVMHTLNTPTADDSLVMFHLRSMGFCGGWKIKQHKNLSYNGYNADDTTESKGESK